MFVIKRLNRFSGRKFLASSQIKCFSSLESELKAITPRSPPDQISKVTENVVRKYVLDKDSKKQVLLGLALNCGVRHELLENAISLYANNKALSQEVQLASTPAHRNIVRNIGNLPNGIGIVCDMRAHLLNLVKSEKDKTIVSGLRKLEETTRDLLTTWFCLSNLKLNRLTWQSSGDILQKIAQYEAVHPVRGLLDFKTRLGTHRRCFYFTHESLPREPLVMVHVALMSKIASSVQGIVQGTDLVGEEKDLNTAIYYSISSTQKGLAGIDLGNLLIKNVAKEIQRDLPNVTVHSTLSPIPGFKNWVLRSLHGHSEHGDIISEKVVNFVSELVGKALEKEQVKEFLLKNLSNDSITTESISSLERILTHLCANYLCKAKRNGFAANPVANFHLRNGAELYRLNWLGDTSARGMTNSFGMMVNYRYYLDKTRENTANYTTNKTIKAHQRVLEHL